MRAQHGEFVMTNKTTGEPHWQWVKESPVAILEENELPAWNNAAQVVKAVKAMGAEFMRYPAIRWGVHSFGKSEFLQKYPDLGERDLFGEIREAMRDNGIKVMAYVHYGVLHSYVKEQHEDWMVRNADGALDRWNGHHYKACLANDDFISAMRGAICELVARYGPDALYLDGPTWYCQECYCDSCKKKYLDMFGEKLPLKLSFEDGSRKKYNIMRDKIIAKIVKDLRESIDLPNFPLLFNTVMNYNWAHRCGRCELTCANADGGNTTEVHRPGSFWDMYESVKLGESLDKVSMCYLPPGPYETLRTFNMQEIKTLGAAYLMHGATPMLGTVSSFLNDETGGPVMREFIDYSNKHRSVYYRSSPVRDVALIFPRSGAEHSAGEDAQKVTDYFKGAFRALLHGHVHFDTFYDTRITKEKLAGYRAAWIPAGVSVSKENADALREYVSDGGSLFASGRFSMMNEDGNKLDNFACSDLLGVDYVQDQPEDHYRTREYRETGPRHGYSLIPEAYLKIRDEKLFKKDVLIPASDGVVGVDNLKRFIEYTVVKLNSDARILADLHLPSGGAFGEPMEFPLGTPPGIVLNRFGKGKVVYMATPIEKNYLRRGLPEIRELVKKLFGLLLDDKPLLKLDAPSGVIANLTEDTDNLYLHLLNYCGTVQNDNYYLEWTAPLFDLKVDVAFDGNAGKIISLGDNREIEFKQREGRVCFSVLKLETFETYVISKGEKQR